MPGDEEGAVTASLESIDLGVAGSAFWSEVWVLGSLEFWILGFAVLGCVGVEGF